MGHKTANTSFFVYKTHIAITPERIITSATITTGEKHNGKELINLIEKSESNGIEVKALISDVAYSEKEILDYCNEKNIKNASKLSKSVTHGNGKNKENFIYNKYSVPYMFGTVGLIYNKDAGMYVCKARHMVIKKTHQKRNRINNSAGVDNYFFDVET